MTVEQYLRKQCMERTDALKRHMEGLIENFEGEAKKARVVLRDVASNAEGSSSRADDAEAADTSTENESSGSNAPLAEAFALVCVQGCFAGRVYRFQPSNSQKKWTKLWFPVWKRLKTWTRHWPSHVCTSAIG